MHAHGTSPFFGSPAEAAQAPPEEFLYIACTREGTGVDEPDFIAVVDASDGRSSTRRRCRTSATSSTTSAGTGAARHVMDRIART